MSSAFTYLHSGPGEGRAPSTAGGTAGPRPSVLPTHLHHFPCTVTIISNAVIQIRGVPPAPLPEPTWGPAPALTCCPQPTAGCDLPSVGCLSMSIMSLLETREQQSLGLQHLQERQQLVLLTLYSPSPGHRRVGRVPAGGSWARHCPAGPPCPAAGLGWAPRQEDTGQGTVPQVLTDS